MRVNHSVADLLAEFAPYAPPAPPTKPAKKRAKHKPTVVVAVDEPAPPPLTQDSDEEEPEDPWLDDPYAVTEAHYTHVTHEEYNASSRVALDPAVQFNFDRFERVSRHAYWNARVTDPAAHYQHDPVVLIDAVALACNMEAAARRAATQVAYDHLVLTENNDVARVLDAIAASEPMCTAIKDAALEYLFALMAVENATRNPPSH